MSYGYDQHTHTHTHTHKRKFKGQSVQKIEWKQTDGQTDATDCFTFLTAVGKKETWLYAT